MIIYDLMTELKLINVTSENTKRKNKIFLSLRKGEGEEFFCVRGQNCDFIL